MAVSGGKDQKRRKIARQVTMHLGRDKLIQYDVRGFLAAQNRPYVVINYPLKE
jgi:hypothetical protein